MRVLLTGARAPATLELARLLARAGHGVHVADTDRWHICRGSRLVSGSHVLPAPRAGKVAYGRAIAGVVSRQRIDVIIPTCEEIFHLAALGDDLGARLVCESLERLRPLHDKEQFVEACGHAGVPAPLTYALPSASCLPELPAGRYILKPRFSRFATFVRTWSTGDALPELAASGWIAQRFVTGGALCTWSVASHGRLLAHATYAVDATAGPRGAAIAFHSVRHAAIRFWAETFIAHFRLSGQFAFDFIDGPDGLYGIECNPRLTSGIHCFRTMPGVTQALVDPTAAPAAPVLEPPEGLSFGSRLALAFYRQPARADAGLLDAEDDPWPKRLQGLMWTKLLLRSMYLGLDPRLVSTRDIEWNGE